MNDVGYVSLSQAAAMCPAVDGRRPNPSTIFRWITKGLDGVRLEHRRIGRRVVTTPEALEQFFAATATAALERLDDVKPTTSLTPKCRSESKRRREIARAEETLAAAGI